MFLTHHSARLRASLTPTRVAFFASLVLSLIAWMSSTINRDGMLYVDTARIFLEHGFSAAKANFSWPFLPIVIAVASKLTGLPFEAAGYLLNALFMAGTTAFLVAASSRNSPQAAWAICCVALALPGINEYRNELVREFGCWFFIMAAFWLALRWNDKPSWGGGLFVQTLVGVSALFRPEAVAMIAALTAWQLFNAPKGERLRRIAMISGVSALCLLLLIGVYLAGRLSSESRLAIEFSRISTARFNAKAEAISATFIEYARGSAKTILFFGSLALIPVKLINKLSFLIIPLLFLRAPPSLRELLRRHALYAWGFVAHLAVLVVFVLDLQFLAGRYVGLLLLCATPFIGVATWHLMQRSRRWQGAIVSALVLLMIGSSFSMSGGKPYFSEAGHWLANNISRSDRVFIGSGRTAYYAGWGYPAIYRNIQISPQTLAATLQEKRYDLYVLEVGKSDTAIGDWIEKSGLPVVQRFADAKGSAVIILGTMEYKATDSPR